MSYLVHGALGVSVQELRDVGHDGLLVGVGDVYVLGVEEPGDPELDLGHVEGGVKAGLVGLLSHRVHVHGACKTNRIESRESGMKQVK